MTREGNMRKYVLNDLKADVKTLCLLDDKVGLRTYHSPSSDSFCQELQYYHSQFKRGMLGPLSYYRTSKVRYEEEQGMHYSISHEILSHRFSSAAELSSNFPSDLPVLFLYGTADRTCQQHLIQKSHEYIPRLQVEALEGHGHWLMIEAKKPVATKVGDWLDDVLRIRGKL
jgi:soluble epoxide hydrolase/lipid-phosphate phosphatase